MWGNQSVGRAIGIVRVAGIGIVAGIANNLSANGVKLDVALAGQEVGVRLHETRPVTSLPKCACPAVTTIQRLHIGWPERLHRKWQGLLVRGCDQQMHMVGHEYISVYRAIVLACRIVQRVEIFAIVAGRKENGSLVYTATDNVLRYSR